MPADLRDLIKKIPLTVPLYEWSVLQWSRFMAERFGRGLRDWTEEDEESMRQCWADRFRPRNIFLKEKIVALRPVNVLEVGSGCGNVLFLLAKELPEARLVGVDINPVAVDCGNTWMKQAGIPNVTLEQGNAEGLFSFPDRGFDVVYSCTSLLYLSPREIEDALRNMLRIARKAVVMLEMHADGAKKYLGEFHRPSNWKRDYRRIFSELGIADKNITIEFVSEQMWQPGGGGGAYIEVRLF